MKWLFAGLCAFGCVAYWLTNQNVDIAIITTICCAVFVILARLDELSDELKGKM